ncbi:MAG: hypothetical protein WDM76_06715 [Limisphaerales bacterium]
MSSALRMRSCGEPTTPPVSDRWTAEKANAWYVSQTWLVGANFVPSTAINQLEMWQADTFDPATIDRELGYAQGIGMNTMRVFLHDLAWREDPEGFYSRVDKYLEIADRHGLKTLFVIFDGVWNPYFKAASNRHLCLACTIPAGCNRPAAKFLKIQPSKIGSSLM